MGSPLTPSHFLLCPIMNLFANALENFSGNSFVPLVDFPVDAASSLYAVMNVAGMVLHLSPTLSGTFPLTSPGKMNISGVFAVIIAS